MRWRCEYVKPILVGLPLEGSWKGPEGSAAPWGSLGSLDSLPSHVCGEGSEIATVPVLLYRRSKMDTYHYVTTHYTPIGRLTPCLPFPRSYGIHGHRPTRLSDVMSPCIRCSPSWKVLRPSTSGNSSCWTIHIRLTPYIPPNQTTGMLALSMSARRLSVLAIYDSHRMMGQ